MFYSQQSTGSKQTLVSDIRNRLKEHKLGSHWV